MAFIAPVAFAGQSVPDVSKPSETYIVSAQNWVGFPAQLVTSTTTALVFPNGIAVSCANWNPAFHKPTKESVGQLKRCKVSPTKPDGKLANRFKPGERIDIAFGNIDGAAFSDASQLKGANLRMTEDGRIAIGRFRSTTVRSGGEGVASSFSRALRGRYALDGHVITIDTDDGDTLHGFIAWSSNSGSREIDHIYINGEHFWRP